MPQAAALPDLIASLYQAAAKNEWPQALKNIGDAMGGAFTLIGVVDKATGRTASLTSEPFQEGRKALYRERYFAINPRSTRAARSKPGDVFTDCDLAERRALDKHPYYAEYLSYRSFGYFVAGNLQNTPHKRVNLSIQRTIRKGHADGPDVALLAGLLPHAAAAFDLWERLQAVSAHAVLSRAALDAMTVGALVVDGNRKLSFANAAGSEALEDTGPLIAKDHLDTRQRGSSHAFQRALDAVFAVGGGEPQHLTVAGSDDRAWRLTIKPMPGLAGVDGSFWQGALILAEVQRPLAKAADLQRELGLTAAEAALAVALADGKSARQYADNANVSINTVRTHLSSLRDKLVAKNQAQIVARVLKALA
jgi:DNA-binding CsgD family transcriptional regulator/PAS domain-containing protein